MKINERDFTKTVIEAAQLKGWWVYHVAFSKGNLRGGSSIGFPDLVLVHPVKGKTLFRELKVGKGKLTESQEMWGQALVSAGQDWLVWRPEDDWLEEL